MEVLSVVAVVEGEGNLSELQQEFEMMTAATGEEKEEKEAAEEEEEEEAAEEEEEEEAVEKVEEEEEEEEEGADASLALESFEAKLNGDNQMVVTPKVLLVHHTPPSPPSSLPALS